MTHLTAIQINSLKAMFAPMDKDELCEALDLLFDEALKRDWPGIFDIGSNHDDSGSGYAHPTPGRQCG